VRTASRGNAVEHDANNFNLHDTGRPNGNSTPRRRKGDFLDHTGRGPATHRLTMDMARAEGLAAMIAKSRAGTFVEVADLLAGMYMYEWDRLSKYWDDEDKVESYLQQICRISPQRWHHWIEIHHKQAEAENAPKKWTSRLTKLGDMRTNLGTKLRTLATRERRKKNGEPSKTAPKLPHSAELMAVWAAAEATAPSTDTVEGRVLPVLTLECVLYAIASRTGSEIGHRLVASGLKVSELESEARNPKHAPR
jgi:hypothetical protein